MMSLKKKNAKENTQLKNEPEKKRESQIPKRIIVAPPKKPLVRGLPVYKKFNANKLSDAKTVDLVKKVNANSTVTGKNMFSPEGLISHVAGSNQPQTTPNKNKDATWAILIALTLPSSVWKAQPIQEQTLFVTDTQIHTLVSNSSVMPIGSGQFAVYMTSSGGGSTGPTGFTGANIFNLIPAKLESLTVEKSTVENPTVENPTIGPKGVAKYEFTNNKGLSSFTAQNTNVPNKQNNIGPQGISANNIIPHTNNSKGAGALTQTLTIAVGDIAVTPFTIYINYIDLYNNYVINILQNNKAIVTKLILRNLDIGTWAIFDVLSVDTTTSTAFIGFEISIVSDTVFTTVELDTESDYFIEFVFNAVV